MLSKAVELFVAAVCIATIPQTEWHMLVVMVLRKNCRN